MFELIVMAVVALIVWTIGKSIVVGSIKGTLLRARDYAENAGVPRDFSRELIECPDIVKQARRELASGDRSFAALDAYEQYGKTIVHLHSKAQQIEMRRLKKDNDLHKTTLLDQAAAYAPLEASSVPTPTGKALGGDLEEGVAAYSKNNYAVAIVKFRLAAAQGNASAQINIGLMYYEGRGVVQDYTEASKWYQLAAVQGYAQAQYNIGLIYHEGKGVAQDDTAALKWFRLAAAQGYAIAEYNIGFMYYMGRGVIQNYTEALKWYKLAAAQGSAQAQYNIGIMYDNGQGVAQDYAEASKWYQLAAVQGDAIAQFSIGFMYDNGQGVVQDYAEGLKWYKLAAAQGSVQAQSNIGLMYATGQGVVQDYVRAHMWWNLAAISGDADAVKNRDILAAGMTSQQISEAQKLARKCLESNFKDCY